MFLELDFCSSECCHAQALLRISRLLRDKFYEGNLRNEKESVCIYEHEIFSLIRLLYEFKS